MDESRATQQRALYGSTLADRFSEVMEHYALTQRELAGILGLSAPMLSQLIHAQRIKIGNPAVYERLVMLETRTSEPDRAKILDEVRASHPILSSQQTATTLPLYQLATPEQLRNTADFAHSIGAERLAIALRTASRAPR